MCGELNPARVILIVAGARPYMRRALSGLCREHCIGPLNQGRTDGNSMPLDERDNLISGGIMFGSATKTHMHGLVGSRGEDYSVRVAFSAPLAISCNPATLQPRWHVPRGSSTEICEAPSGP